MALRARMATSATQPIVSDMPSANDNSTSKHDSGALNPREAKHRYRKGAWQEPDARGERVSTTTMLLVPGP
jgi:hypothetical protein